MSGILAGLDMAGPYIQTGLNYLIQKDAAKRQARENMKLAQFQNDANLKYMQAMNEYNTPQNQMTRFQDAGLNPNLIYGQGNPGNQSSPQQAARPERVDYQTMANILPLLNQSKMVESQVQANDAKTRQATVMAKLNDLQAQVVAKNPLLNDEGFKAIIDSLKSTAEIKASDSSLRGQLKEWSLGERTWNMGGEPMHGPAGALKLEMELQNLLKRFDLSTQDQAIKAEIVKSKEFQNAILEVQKKWMADGEITPQHILQFVQLLLMKML